MKSFKTVIAGMEVTHENFLSVAKSISDKYGVCPALNSVVMACVSYDETIELSRKGLKMACDKYIKLFGYSPKYFASVLSKIGYPE